MVEAFKAPEPMIFKVPKWQIDNSIINLEKTISNIFNIRKRTKRLGLEIEMEGLGLPTEVEGWHCVEDGSLRGDENLEYVLKEPMDLIDTLLALDNLEYALDNSNSTVDETIRAGVHVHVNVSDITFRQMMCFITGYYIFEDFLCDYCGPERVSNHFCLRLSDTIIPAMALRDALALGRLNSLSSENIRYSALNFNSLFRHGSLEFRAMRSTPQFSYIAKWVAILNELFTHTTNRDSDPTEIIRMFSGDGPKTFVNKFLPTYGEELILSQPDHENRMRNCLRNCQLYAYAIRWRD